MRDSLLAPSRGPKGIHQAPTGPHVRARFQDAPEMTGLALEHLRPQGAFAGGDALLVQLQRLLAGRRVLGQEHVSIGTVGPEFQSPAGQLRALRGIVLVERLIHEFLGLGSRRARAEFFRRAPHPAFDGAAIRKVRWIIRWSRGASAARWSVAVRVSSSSGHVCVPPGENTLMVPGLGQPEEWISPTKDHGTARGTAYTCTSAVGPGLDSGQWKTSCPCAARFLACW